MTVKGVTKCGSCGESLQVHCMICNKDVCTDCGKEIFIEMDDDEMLCIERCDADDHANPSFLICEKCFDSFRNVVDDAPIRMKREILKEVIDILKKYVLVKKV